MATNRITSENAAFIIEIVSKTLREIVEPTLPEGRSKLLIQTAYDLLAGLIHASHLDRQTPWGDLLRELPASLSHAVPSEGDEAALIIAPMCEAMSATAGFDPDVAAWLSQVARLERQAIEDLPSLESGYTLSAECRLPNYDPAVPVAARLVRYFETRPDLTKGQGPIIVELLGGGSSKGSYLVRCGEAVAYVVRMDGAHLPFNSTVKDEYPLLNFLQPFELPHPRAILLEEDSSVCGAPFIIFEKSEGAAGPAGWGSPEQFRQVALELASFLAKLHSVPTATLVANPPSWLDPLHLCRSVQGTVEFWHHIRRSPEPFMEAIMSWLEAHQPVAQGAPVIVHGDAGFHNVLAANGHLTAVLDWESAHLGQPEEDIGYLFPFVSSVMSWDDFYSAYRAAGGRETSLDNQKFYSVLAYARIALSLYHSLFAISISRLGLDTKDVWIANHYARRFALETFQRIIE